VSLPDFVVDRKVFANGIVRLSGRLAACQSQTFSEQLAAPFAFSSTADGEGVASSGRRARGQTARAGGCASHTANAFLKADDCSQQLDA